MRIVFLGLSQFGSFFFERLLSSGQKVAGVVTIIGPGNRIQQRSTHMGIPLYSLRHKRDFDYRDWLKHLRPDLGVIAGFNQILPEDILTIPSHGFWNIHGSLLPAYRGPQPLERQIMMGESRSGVTIHQVVKRPDAGPIIGQVEIILTEHDTLASAFLKLSRAGGRLFLKTLQCFSEGLCTYSNQDEPTASYYPAISDEERRINWNWNSHRIYNLIRAMPPHHPAFTTIKGRHIDIISAHLLEKRSGLPEGTVIEVLKDKAVTAASPACLQVHPSRLNHHLNPGDRFDSASTDE